MPITGKIQKPVFHPQPQEGCSWPECKKFRRFCLLISRKKPKKYSTVDNFKLWSKDSPREIKRLKKHLPSTETHTKLFKAEGKP